MSPACLSSALPSTILPAPPARREAAAKPWDRRSDRHPKKEYRLRIYANPAREEDLAFAGFSRGLIRPESAGLSFLMPGPVSDAATKPTIRTITLSFGFLRSSAPSVVQR